MYVWYIYLHSVDFYLKCRYLDVYIYTIHGSNGYWEASIWATANTSIQRKLDFMYQLLTSRLCPGTCIHDYWKTKNQNTCIYINDGKCNMHEWYPDVHTKKYWKWGLMLSLNPRIFDDWKWLDVYRILRKGNLLSPLLEDMPSLKPTVRTWKLVVGQWLGRWLSPWEGLFSGPLLVSGRVMIWKRRKWWYVVMLSTISWHFFGWNSYPLTSGCLQLIWQPYSTSKSHSQSVQTKYHCYHTDRSKRIAC